MSHILAALLGENSRIFNTTYKRDIDTLVKQLKDQEKTVENKNDRSNLPIYKPTS